MFDMVANGTLPARKYICSPLKSEVSIWVSLKFVCLEAKVLRMKTKLVYKFFISSVLTSNKQCPNIPYFGLVA